MSHLTYGQIEQALRRAGFVRTKTGSHNLWQTMGADGVARRVILCARSMRLVPAPVLERLARQAGLTPAQLGDPAGGAR
ncbi:MAG: hypothetical protein ACE5R4_08610 [Armatimonadota bacterium]